MEGSDEMITSMERIRAKDDVAHPQEFRGENNEEEEDEGKSKEIEDTENYSAEYILEKESSLTEIRLSDFVFLFPTKKISEHGNVFEGEIRSGVYGVRSCVIKFSDISEQNVREARILNKLGSHTNVIAIIQSGTYSDILEDRVFIALDKCHHQNLGQYLSSRRQIGIKFDIDQAIDFAHQIIDGMVYIHDNKIVHLDLKPSNILLSPDLFRIKIADFGVSRELRSTFSKLHLNTQFGTDGYRPIESFGDGWVSLRSDIFSLGAVLYHLLSNGQNVFGCDEYKYAYNVYNNEIDTSHLLVQNPKATEHLIKLMLNNERCRRPTIWQVADHPCWTGTEMAWEFDYGCDEEIDDSEAREVIPKSCESDDSDSDNMFELIRALKRNEIIRTKNRLRDYEMRDFDGESQKLESGERDETDDAKMAENASRLEELQSKLSDSLDEIGTLQSSTLLKKIRELGDSDDLKNLLQISECELHLRRGKGEKTLKRLTKAFSNSKFSAVDVKKMGEKLHERKSYVRALILYRVSNDLLQTQDDSDETVEVISDLIASMSLLAKPLAQAGGRLRDVAAKYISKYTEKCLNDLRKIDNVSSDIRALNVSRSLNNIAAICDFNGDHQKSIRFGQEGVSILENQFGNDVAKHRYYGMLLNNLGVAYRNSGRVSDAEKYFSRSLEAKQEASGYNTEREKSRDIEKTTRNLARLSRLK